MSQPHTVIWRPFGAALSLKGITSLSQCSIAVLKTNPGNSSVFLVARWWGGGSVHFTVGLQLFPSPSFLPFLEMLAFFEHSQTTSPLLNLLLAMSALQFLVINSE